MSVVPEYIARRIRRPIPNGSSVVPGSTPVVSFGNSRVATTATLGINPSRVEFLDSSGNLLTDNRRLSTHESLGVTSLADASPGTISQVLDDCDNYFSLNPYRRWFDQLETILNQSEASYYDGTACHLDLIQWATDPTWGGLDKSQKTTLLTADTQFLLDQLTNESLSVLFVNGSAVIRQLRRSLDIEFAEQSPITGFARHDTRFFTGTIAGITVVGWSTNIQSSFGVSNELRREIALRSSELVASHAIA